jgi:hypothetical protein
MTGRDPFPFGKYGPLGAKLTLQQLKDEAPDYIDWLFKQDWFESKWPKYAEWFKSGDASTSTEDERKTITTEESILSVAPIGFNSWWKTAYGERLRRDGGILYIAHLRVALAAWNGAIAYAEGSGPSTTQTNCITAPVLKTPRLVTTPITFPKPTQVTPSEDVTF